MKVAVSTIGLTTRRIDDPGLLGLLNALSVLSVNEDASLTDVILTLKDNHCGGAAGSKWCFSEQLNLHDWVRPLNLMDHILKSVIESNRWLLLVGGKNMYGQGDGLDVVAAQSLQDCLDLSNSLVVEQLETLLRFLSAFLKNCVHKNVFNSVEHLLLLLSSSEDTISTLALECLTHLALPPMVQRQLSPDIQTHATALHGASPSAHAHLLALARGWGSRGSGLGLYTCVTVDDSQQPTLPQHAGDLSFEFFVDGTLVNIFLAKEEINKKGGSTAGIFFKCMAMIADKGHEIPTEKQLLLIASIRLARGFRSNAARIAAVERRLLALTCVIHVHSSFDILAGYFMAQPELCVELVDLVRPALNLASGSSLSSLCAAVSASSVPHSVRLVAITALNSLIYRRDGSSGGMSSVAKQTNVLSELGVGKGRYLGLLPSLVRFSLASFNSSLEPKGGSVSGDDDVMEDSTEISLGMVFLEATKAKELPLEQQEEQALEFIETILSLTLAVVNVPSGTAAMTDCGLIPALVSVFSTSETHHKNSRLDWQRKYIASQAVQILDAAIVAHTSAFTSFHELNGVDSLVKCLQEELEEIQQASTVGDNAMVENQAPPKRKLTASNRVILYNIVNCLTVVFHQQEASSHPSGGNHLRTPALTAAMKELLDNMDSYGGLLIALVSTLLSDIMNADPQVVHHVHDSGIAASFLAMLKGEKPKVPPSAELFMAIPNVLAALSLTENGARIVCEHNPFPTLLAIFHDKEYAMPQSKCLLNDMTAIVGSGIDELMRHVPNSRLLATRALVDAVKAVVTYGEALVAEEKEFSSASGEIRDGMVERRTCLMQFAHNVCQLLEHILHTSDHIGPFVQSGGFEALLGLYPLLVAVDSQFLSHVSCLSNPALAHLTHFAPSTALTLTVKSIISHYDLHKIFPKLIAVINEQLDEASRCQQYLKSLKPGGNDDMETNDENDLNAYGVLGVVPHIPLHELPSVGSSASNDTMLKSLSNYLASIASTEWLSSILAVTIRTAGQRSNEMMSWGSSRDTQWKKELASKKFRVIMDRLTKLFSTSQLEVCRVRSEVGFETREGERRQSPKHLRWHPAQYTLRIVCQDGAIVRDGIEIDSCASVGNLEMGEIVTATDRCINSSGVMRYHIDRGWISELTRGHGREPIAEVMHISGTLAGNEKTPYAKADGSNQMNKRIDIGVFDLCTAGASVLARLQNSHKAVLAALSKAVTQSIPRSLWGRSHEHISISTHSATLCRIAVDSIQTSFREGLMYEENRSKKSDDSDPDLVPPSGLAVYLGSLLDILHVCLYEERRERKSLNVFLLVALLHSDELLSKDDLFLKSTEDCGDDALPKNGFIGAARFVLKQSLLDMNSSATGNSTGRVRVTRTVAASLPPTLALLSKLTQRTLLSNWNVKSIISKLGGGDVGSVGEMSTGDFVREFHCLLARVGKELWLEKNLVRLPAHLLNPVLDFVSALLNCLKEGCKPPSSGEERNVNSSSSGANAGSGQARAGGNSGPTVRAISVADLHRRLALGMHNLPGGMQMLLGSNGGSRGQPFEASEEAVTQLMDMGFGRDHALEALEMSGTNRVEVAMEYALTHPPPSPASAERRRQQRSVRVAAARRAQERAAAASAAETQNETSENATAPSTANAASSSSAADPANEAAAIEDTATAPEPPKKEVQNPSITRAKAVHDNLFNQVTDVSFNIMEGEGKRRSSKDENLDGDAETEGITVLVASFLLHVISKSYPDDLPKLVWSMLIRLQSHLSKSGKVLANHEHAFAALCHCATIILRALPKLRPLVLRKGLCSLLTKCLKSGAGSSSSGHPVWLSSALLLLDVLAQPTTIPSDTLVVDGVTFENQGKKSEYQRCVGEHKKQSALLSKCAQDMFAIIETGEVAKREKKKGKEKSNATASATDSKDKAPKKAHLSSAEDDSKPAAKTTTGSEKEKSKDTPFPPIPTYVALMPSDEADSCIHSCYRILRSSSPPGVMHAVLILLARIVRNYKLAMKFLRLGGAELILGLPAKCRFVGKTGLVTVILRHLLEDDCALRTSMEAEIRCTVTRLHKKQRRGTNANAGGKVKVTASSFVQAIAPLICRDPIVFLKAAAISVTTEISSPNGDDGNRSRSNSSIVLLSAEERSKHCKALADYFSSSQNSNSYLSHSHRSHSKSNTGTSGGKRKHASPSNTDANKGSNKSKKKCDKVSPKRSRYQPIGENTFLRVVCER